MLYFVPRIWCMYVSTKYVYYLSVLTSISCHVLLFINLLMYGLPTYGVHFPAVVPPYGISYFGCGASIWCLIFL